MSSLKKKYGKGKSLIGQKKQKENKNIKYSDSADSNAMEYLSERNYSKIWKYT